jgi:hypothetical protein
MILQDLDESEQDRLQPAEGVGSLAAGRAPNTPQTRNATPGLQIGAISGPLSPATDDRDR